MFFWDARRIIVFSALWICIVACEGVSPAFASQAQTTVERLSVTVQIDGGKYDLPPPLRKRMQAGVYTIADNVLLGHRIEEVTEREREYGKLIQDVFDRIVMGYTVKNVDIIAGAETNIVVTVVPWQDVIQELAVTVEVDQMPENVKSLVLKDIRGIENIFISLLAGLPLDAIEWTNGIVKRNLQDFLSVKLPEFRAEFEIIPREVTQVNVILYPKGAVVRDIDLSLRSESIPNLALLNSRPAVQRRAEVLLGVPVQFVERHSVSFQEQFAAVLSQDRMLNSFSAKTAIDMQVGIVTKININADTDKYHVFAEGYLDIGRENDNTSARLHMGKYISPLDEVFLEVDFFPHQVKWVFMPGISRKLTPKLTLGYQYDLDASRHMLWAKQKLGGRFLLRIEHRPEDSFNEFALRYKLNDFFGVEYVLNDDDRWLRMVGNF